MNISKKKVSNGMVFSIRCLVLITLFCIALLGCEKSTESDNIDDLISGKYEFTLIPENSFQDTTLIKGMQGTDYEEYSITYDDVFLYEDGAGNITGNTAIWKFAGSRTGNSISLDLYIHQDGPVDFTAAIDSMHLFTSMNLTINDYGFLEGNGMYYEYDYFPGLTSETYTVKARKLADLTPSDIEELTTFGYAGINRFNFCDVISNISSFIISLLTDGVFRPIGNCYLHHDGGGYYIYGNKGPGSIFPLYTQTVYFPYEWSWCKVRSYHFEISLEGETLSYDALKTAMESLDRSMHNFTHELGFDNLQLVFDAMDDFFQEFGGFAFSIAYDTHTHNLSLYVNHASDRNDEVRHHPLIQSLIDAFEPHVNNVYVYSGHHIHDSWHLRRSDVGVCNSQLLIMYLFGTHNVKYD